MSAFRATDEQTAVFDVMRSGEDAVVEAGPGSGKTRTAREGATLVPNQRVLCLMYNRAAAQEAKASFPAHVKCSTVHGLAYGAVGRHYAQRLAQPYESPEVVAARLGVRGRLRIDNGQHAYGPAQLVGVALAMIDRFCYSSDPEISKWHLPPMPGIPTVEDIKALHAEAAHLHRAGEVHHANLVKAEWQRAVTTYNSLADAVLPIARRAWEDLRDPHGGAVRFQHDHYLKMWQLRKPRLRYDMIILDEAQDSNPCRSSLVLAQQHAQRIAIGDSQQQLYAWQGAVDALATWPAQQRLFLTQSFRFGNAVAEETNKWLTLLDAQFRVTGNPAIPSTIGEVDTPDAVLCRTNAGAIGQVVAMLEAGRRPALVGETAKELISLATAAAELKSGKGTSHRLLYTFESWGQVEEYAEEDSGADLRVLVKLVREYEPDGLLKALAATTDEASADVTITTAHRSKGREWGGVVIANDYPEPEDQDIDGDALVARDEAMLAYVAVSRAQNRLSRGSLAYVDSLVDDHTARHATRRDRNGLALASA